jgi:hypothetical protein
MTGPETLFRREALEFRARNQAATVGVVRLGARWLRLSYGVTLLLVVLAVAVGFVVRTDETATGPAVVNTRTGTFAALLPAAISGDLPSARRLSLQVAASGTTLTAVRVTRAQPAEAGTRQPGLPTPEAPAIVLSGRLTSPPVAPSAAARSRLPARAIVELRSERLVDVVVRELSTMVGRGPGDAGFSS